jgi:hypothetical protein
MTKINFSGSVDQVKRQIEETIATYELLGNRSTVTFEQWYESWEKGWPEATENRGLGNYPLNGENQWRANPENWPRWRQFSVEKGIIKGEYWRDRSREKESIPLSGTAEQIIDQIIKLEFPSAVAGDNKGKSQQWPPMKGQPQIRLFFKGENKAEAETSFRIMNKTDDSKIPLSIIDKSDLRRYAEKIKQEFATSNLFVWQKGKEAFSYKNRWQGFDGQWWLCRNEAAGRALLTKLLAITELPLDNSKTRLSKATDENLAFPVDPPDVLVLGEPVPQYKERPLVDVVFYQAEIKLSKMRLPIPLVERGLVVYN